MTVEGVATCPHCGAGVVGAEGFLSWCRDCGWNADPQPARRRKQSRMQRWWRARQNALALRLAANVHTENDLRRGERAVRIAVWVLAGAIHLMTLSLLAGAVLIFLSDLWLPIRIVVGALLVGLFATVQPFYRRRPEREFVLDRDAAPELFGLVDEVAAAVGTTGVRRIVVSSDYNAMYSESRRQPTLEIGLALWVVLSPDERLALLGHEMGHRVNNDLRELLFVNAALISLFRWLQMLAFPGTPWWRRHVTASGDSLASLVILAEMVLPILLFPVTLLVLGIGTGLDVMSQRQGQRAEYYADALGARVAGTPAALALVDKLLIAEGCYDEMTRVVKFRRNTNIWSALRDYVATLPDSEWERLRRNARARLHRIDVTHPPSALRIDVLRRLEPHTPQCSIDDERMGRISAELNSGAVAAADQLRANFGVG